MAQIAKCSFQECACELITISHETLDETKQVFLKLPRTFFDSYKLFQKPSAEPKKELDFFITESFWDFDNIGVSRSIQSLNLDEDRQEDTTFSFSGKEYKIVQASKYLVCSECDRGPVGLVLTIQENSSTGDGQKREICLLSLESVDIYG